MEEDRCPPLPARSGVLEQEFRRLLRLEFDKLLSAHGALVRSGAHAAVEAAVEKTFARTRGYCQYYCIDNIPSLG
jgi:hypothetical protein